MWRHNGTSWVWMTNKGHVGKIVVWDGKPVVDFGAGFGLRYYDGTGWHWMSNQNDVANMIAWNDKLVVDWGGERRMFTYTMAHGWQWLNNVDGGHVQGFDIVLTTA